MAYLGVDRRARRALGHTTRSGARALALLHYWDTDAMNRQPSSHNNDSDFEVTVPSRLDELTANSRLEQQERNAAGWRRNLTYLGVVLAAVVCYYLVRN